MVFYISSLVARYVHVMIVLFLISSQVVDDFRQSTLHKREGEHNKFLRTFMVCLGHTVSCLMVKPWLGSRSGVEEACYGAPLAAKWPQ